MMHKQFYSIYDYNITYTVNPYYMRLKTIKLSVVYNFFHD